MLHPRAKVTSKHAPVTIGEGCIICERSSVGLLSGSGKTDDGGKEGAAEQQQNEVVLEAGVCVEVGAQVEARTVGEGSVVGVNARVGKGAVLGKVGNSDDD